MGFLQIFLLLTRFGRLDFSARADVSLGMAQSKDNQHDAPHTRIEILRPEWLIDEVDRRLQPQGSKWKRFTIWFVDKMLPLLITVGLAIGGYLVNAKLERDSLKKTVEKEKLEETYRQKNEMYNVILTALSNYRRTLDEILEDCRYDPRNITNKKAQHEYTLRRIRAGYDIVNAAPGEKFVFGEELLDKILSFTAWINTIPNVCAKDAPPETEYRSRENDIKLIMVKSILETEKILDKEFKLKGAKTKVTLKELSPS